MRRAILEQVSRASSEKPRYCRFGRAITHFNLSKDECNERRRAIEADARPTRVLELEIAGQMPTAAAGCTKTLPCAIRM